MKLDGLRSFTYTLGWYNVIDEHIQNEKERPSRIEPGFYSFQQLKQRTVKRTNCLKVSYIA